MQVVESVSFRDLAPVGDVPGLWIAPENRPTHPDTEAPPEDHGTEIAPDTWSCDTVSVKGSIRHFGARYFRALREACTKEPPCSSTPTSNHGLPRRPLRALRQPGHLRDFLPSQ